MDEQEGGMWAFQVGDSEMSLDGNVHMTSTDGNENPVYIDVKRCSLLYSHGPAHCLAAQILNVRSLKKGREGGNLEQENCI